MGNNRQIFEVKVEVKRNGSSHYSPHVGMYIERKTVEMFHINARTNKQAMQRCEKYGRPIGARKVDGTRSFLLSNSLLELHGLTNPYPDAIAMDEMIWKRKTKRAERMESREKDKQGY